MTKWGDSSRDWDRRAKVLTAVGAPIGAIAALVSFTNNEQLIRVSSGIVAGVSFVGAAVGFFFVLRSSREQKREDVAALDVLLRTRVARVADIDPVMIGVDEAATTELTPAGEMEYLPRVADAELKGLIADALDGRGRWFVVVEGTSKTGKSRTLFEALKTADRDEQLHLFAPRGSAELLQILKRPEPIKTAGRLVLWLNDIEPLVAQGMAYDDLTRFREVYPGGLVVGTYGGKTEEAAAAVGEARLAPLAEAVLNHAARVLLPMTSAPELASLVTEMTAGARADLERYGLAAYLVAGPQVQAKVVAGLHPGRSPSQLGSAIVNAVLDWARCGRTTPLPEPDLRSLVQEYDPQGPPVTDSDFASALEWALLPMAGRVTVIHRVKDGLGAFDYARAVRASQTPTPHIPEAVWTAAAQTCREAEAAVVGEAAYVSGQLEVALIALSAAAESNDAPLVGIALFNKGVTLGQLDRSEAAVAVYDLIESRYGTDPTPALREIVATALYNKGFRLGQLDRSEEEVAVYDLIESRYGTDPTPALRERVAKALVNKGFRLGQLDRPEKAVAVYDLIESRYGTDPAPALREQVATALVNKGVTLGQLDRSEEEVAVYDLIESRYGTDPTPALREIVATALYNKGFRLGQLDRPEEEVAVYDLIESRYGTDPRLAAIIEHARALRQAAREQQVP